MYERVEGRQRKWQVDLGQLLGSLYDPNRPDLMATVQAALEKGDDPSKLLLAADNTLVEKSRRIYEVEPRQFSALAQPIVEAILNEAEAARKDGQLVRVTVELRPDKIVVSGNGKGMDFSRHFSQLVSPHSGDKDKIRGQFGQGTLSYWMLSDNISIETHPEDEDKTGFRARLNKVASKPQAEVELLDYDSSRDSGTTVIFDQPRKKNGQALTEADFDAIETYIKEQLVQLYYAEVTLVRPDKKVTYTVNEKAVAAEKIVAREGGAQVIFPELDSSTEEKAQVQLDVTGSTMWKAPNLPDLLPLTLNLPRQTMTAETRTAEHLVLRDQDVKDCILVCQLIVQQKEPAEAVKYLAQISLLLGSLPTEKQASSLSSAFQEIAQLIESLLPKGQKIVSYEDGLEQLEISSVLVADQRVVEALTPERQYSFALYQVSDRETVSVAGFAAEVEDQWFVRVGKRCFFNAEKVKQYQQLTNPQHQQVYLKVASEMSRLYVLANPDSKAGKPPQVFNQLALIADASKIKAAELPNDKTVTPDQRSEEPAELLNETPTLSDIELVSDRSEFWYQMIQAQLDLVNSVAEAGANRGPREAQLYEIFEQVLKTPHTSNMGDYYGLGTNAEPGWEDEMSYILSTGTESLFGKDKAGFYEMIESLSQLSYPELLSLVDKPSAILAPFLDFMKRFMKSEMALLPALREELLSLYAVPDTAQDDIDSDIRLFDSYLEILDEQPADRVFAKPYTDFRLTTLLAILFSEEAPPLEQTGMNIPFAKQIGDEFCAPPTMSCFWKHFCLAYPNEALNLRRKLLASIASVNASEAVGFTLLANHSEAYKKHKANKLAQLEAHYSTGYDQEHATNLVIDQLRFLYQDESLLLGNTRLLAFDSSVVSFLDTQAEEINTLMPYLVQESEVLLYNGYIEASLIEALYLLQTEHGVSPTMLLQAFRTIARIDLGIHPLYFLGFGERLNSTDGPKFLQYGRNQIELSQSAEFIKNWAAITDQKQLARAAKLYTFFVDRQGYLDPVSGAAPLKHTSIELWGVMGLVAAKCTDQQLDVLLQAVEKEDAYGPFMVLNLVKLLAIADEELLELAYSSPRNAKLINILQNWFLQDNKAIRSPSLQVVKQLFKEVAALVPESLDLANARTYPDDSTGLIFNIYTQDEKIHRFDLSDTSYSFYQEYQVTYDIGQGEWEVPSTAIEADSTILYAVFLSLTAQGVDPDSLTQESLKELAWEMESSLSPEQRKQYWAAIKTSIEGQDSDLSRFVTEWITNAQNAWYEKHEGQPPTDKLPVYLATMLSGDGSLVTSITDQVGANRKTAIWQIARSPGMGDEATVDDNLATFHAGTFTSINGAKEVRVKVRDDNGLTTYRKIVPIYDSTAEGKVLVSVKEYIWEEQTDIYGQPLTQNIRVEPELTGQELVNRRKIIRNRVFESAVLNHRLELRQAHLSRLGVPQEVVKKYVTEPATLYQKLATRQKLEYLAGNEIVEVLPDQSRPLTQTTLFGTEYVRRMVFKKNTLAQGGVPVGKELPTELRTFFPPQFTDALEQAGYSFVVTLPPSADLIKARDGLSQVESFVDQHKAELQLLAIQTLAHALCHGLIQSNSGLYSYDLQLSYRGYHLSSKEREQLEALVTRQQPIELDGSQDFFELAKKMALNLPVAEITNSDKKLSVVDLLAVNQGGHYFLQFDSLLQNQPNKAIGQILQEMVTFGRDKGDLKVESHIVKKFMWLDSPKAQREQKLQQALIDALYPDKSKPPSKLAKKVIERCKRYNQAQLERFKSETAKSFLGLGEVVTKMGEIQQKSFGESRSIPESLQPSPEINHYFILRDLFVKAVQSVKPEVSFSNNDLRFNLGSTEYASAKGRGISINMKSTNGTLSYPELMYQLATEQVSLEEIVPLLKTAMHEAAHADENRWSDKHTDRSVEATHDLAFRKKEEANFRALMNLWLDSKSGEPELFKVWRELLKEYLVSVDIEPVVGEHFFSRYLKQRVSP